MSSLELKRCPSMNCIVNADNEWKMSAKSLWFPQYGRPYADLYERPDLCRLVIKVGKDQRERGEMKYRAGSDQKIKYQLAFHEA
ncbi:hypothetical protein [Paraburkholderia fungorum]|uniref:hypothetical protein n=1 Tax=Paraburkholderia fungorum TaxID=134537 RepID=UPI0038BCBB55